MADSSNIRHACCWQERIEHHSTYKNNNWIRCKSKKINSCVNDILREMFTQFSSIDTLIYYEFHSSFSDVKLGQSFLTKILVITEIIDL